MGLGVLVTPLTTCFFCFVLLPLGFYVDGRALLPSPSRKISVSVSSPTSCKREKEFMLRLSSKMVELPFSAFEDLVVVVESLSSRLFHGLRILVLALGGRKFFRLCSFLEDSLLACRITPP